MGLFNRREVAELKAELAALKAQVSVQAPAFLREGLSPFEDLPGLTLPDRQAELYQRLSWVYTAVSITARTAASAGFNVMRLVGEKTEQIDNHPFEERLRNPNPLQSRTEFLESVFGFRQLTGNAYIWLNRATPTAPPSEMWIIPPQNIEPIPDKQMYLKGYLYDGGHGKRVPLETWEICHLKLFHPRNAFVGLSPIEALAVTATGDLAMGQWNTNFFDKQNAKPAGALAFSDRINDNDWERMQREIKQQHGGTERRMMMLRNAGTGGVSWVQFGVNQKDMEFLQARTFNKEEIFAALAPGLSSMLAVNATEANSKAGRETFAETTIWPMHQAISEKFTRDILPAYGDGLIGEFDDMRSTDRALELQEQQVAFNILTVAEAREKFFNLGPLGDARDASLVSGAPAPTVAVDSNTSNDTTAPGNTPKGDIFGYHIEQGVVTKNETRAQLGLPPQDDKGERQLQDALRRLNVVQAAVVTGIDIENALQLAGLSLPRPLKEPAAAPVAMGKALRGDLLKWQRKAYKRAKAGGSALCPFDSDAIPDTLAAAINGALETAHDTDDVRAVFGAVLDHDLEGVLGGHPES